MTSPRNMLTPIVWVMAPVVSGNDPAFPWDWSAWTREPRLLCRTSMTAKCASGTAQFQLVRRVQYPEGGPDFAIQPSTFRAGCYVLVTTGTTVDTTNPAEPVEVPDFDSIAWFGVITATDFENAGTGDYIGTVTGQEIGESILDTQRITGFRQDDGTGYPTRLLSAPSANLNGVGDKIIGNAVLGNDGSGHPVYLFARDLSACGNVPADQGRLYWTRWRLLTHIATFCMPSGCPRVVIRLEDGSGITGDDYAFDGHNPASLAAYLDATASPEVYELDGLTLRGAIDLLAAPGSGLGWRFALAQIGGAYVWQITVFSRSELNSSYGPPKTEPNPTGQRVLSTSYVANDEQTLRIDFAEDDTARYDQVIVEGGRILFGVTLSALDGNLDRAWNAGQETAYIAAEDSERSSPQFADVYTTFTVKRSGTGEPTRATNPGTNDAPLPLIPQITTTLSGTDLVAVISAAAATVYLPGLRFSETVPWIEGVKPQDGTTDSSDEVKCSPSYLKPRVYSYRATETAFPWVDLLSRIEGPAFTPLSESPAVDIDDRRPGIRVTYTRPHVLGLDTFTGTTDGGASPAYDWRQMLVTVGIPSNQRVEARRVRKVNGVELPADRLRRSLVIRDENLNFWACLAGTVVGVSADNLTPIRVATDTVLVNDYQAAQAYCDEIAERSFRAQESATIVHVNDGSTRAVWKVGMSLFRVDDGPTSRRISGVIAALDTDWNAGTVTLRTEIPPPRLPFNQSPSPSRGGTVSPELGGTIAQVVQQQGAATKKLAAQMSQRPLIPAMGGGSAPAPAGLYIVVGGNLIPGCLAQGVQKRTDAVAGSELPVGTGGPGVVVQSAFPVPTGLPNGVGVMRQVGTGTHVFALLDSGSAYPGDVATPFAVVGGATVNLDRVVGSTTYRYPCVRVDA